MNEVDLKLKDLFADLNSDKKILDDKTDLENGSTEIKPGLEKLTIDNVKVESSEKHSRDFDAALKKVIEKDLKQLSNKVNSIVDELTKRLLKSSNVNISISNDINHIENIINDVESVLSSLILQKHGIKVHLLSSHKKEKRAKIKFLEEEINYVSSVQSNLISIKNEIENLNQKKKELMKDTSYDTNETKDEEEAFDDILERTINFYMNRGKDL